MPESKTYYPSSLREEELKNRVAHDWFGAFDCARIIGNIDFCVDVPATELDLGYAAEPMLWAEAKAGNRKDIVASFVQLILTIGGEHAADKNLPPHFLGAFDAEKIAFLPYNAVLDVLGKNDFDWTVAPSDHESKEFKELYNLAKGVVEREKLMFRYTDDEAALRRFIKSNFKSGRRDITKILINKNNFTHIYRQWREAVMPFINAPWDVLKKKYAIYDRDFYLAEMNIDDNGTADIADDHVANDFYITFDAKSSTPYTVKRKNEDDLFATIAFGFKPGGLDAYAAFWRRYKRPPRKDYWNFIVNRLDLLVPQDVRERKGSFFTPKKWVELSQHYLELALGENWQDEYFVWDCAGGTGNLEVGLTNKYNVFVSTLDQQDIDVIHERIKNGANLLDSHVFQFDFLNDSFDRLPLALKEIIDDPEKRKKLVIYINPPYAEAGDIRQRSGTGQNKTDVSVAHSIYDRYVGKIGLAGRELFTLFLMRIHDEIPDCIIGQFSKLKHLQAPNFKQFRHAFRGNLEKCFIAPSDTFDNVKGKFPIGFFVWRLGEDVSRRDAETQRVSLTGFTGLTGLSGAKHQAPSTNNPVNLVNPVQNNHNLRVSASLREEKSSVFTSTVADVYDRKGEFIGTKTILAYDNERSINDWLIETRGRSCLLQLGFLSTRAHDIQDINTIYIKRDKSLIKSARGSWITDANLVEAAVYLASCHSVEADWMNDRDQFLFPNDGWKGDAVFQGDCLVFTLFHGQNRISSRDGVNHWIPFTEAEVDAKERFASHFMSDYLRASASLRENLSPAAKSVLDAGRELWRYYHAQPNANPNASFYDIRLHFQGATVDAKGKAKMNSTSADETYTSLLANLRVAMKNLARQIEPKVYEYGFLKK